MPTVELNPGLQVYEVAPLAIKVAVCCPQQIVELLTVTVGFGLTAIVPVIVAVQAFVAVTNREVVYVPDDVKTKLGFCVTLSITPSFVKSQFQVVIEKELGAIGVDKFVNVVELPIHALFAVKEAFGIVKLFVI